MLRTHTCGELTKKQHGQTVELCGWVHSRRNLGNLIFIDLRDHFGLTQLTINPREDALKQALSLRQEWVIKITGQVNERPKTMINKNMATGEIEIEVSDLEILSKSDVLPFEINNDDNLKQANEALRLKYRFLDLRRPALQQLLMLKDQFITYMRQYFHKHQFTEIQTPILANSSPEGARDFLIPSRLYPGKFYALPQAPQQFKQLLMVSGFDRYFQVAPCFRDEDTRVDRHYGEFYQLDMEMSFVGQEDVFEIMEPLMIELVNKFTTKKIVGLEHKRFKKIPWREAMNKYGTDKPDLRYDLEIMDISDLVKNCGLGIFSQTVADGNPVMAFKVPAGAKLTAGEITKLEEVAKSKGAKGLAYMALKDRKIVSAISKFLGQDLTDKIVKQVGAREGDIIFFSAGVWKIACESLGAVRVSVAETLKLIDKNLASFVWIVDFPMYELTTDNKIDFGHNPFSMPQGGLESLQNKDPLDILAYQFDLVLNGFEVSSGAVRNHDPEIMYKAFALAGYDKSVVEEKFGAMLKAFAFGAPPHAGNAPGIDRLLMVLFDLDSIRDIYAFPKDGQGRDCLMDSPSEVDKKLLKELGL